MEDIDHYEIPIYNFPYDVEEDDEDTIADNIELRVSNCFSPLETLFLFKDSNTGSVAVRRCRLRGRGRD